MIIFCSVQFAEAQTFLEHLQKKETDKASVTVSQSKVIDELVNGKPQLNESVKQQIKPITEKKSLAQPEVGKPTKIEGHLAPEVVHKTKVEAHKNESTIKTDTESGNEMNIPTVDLRKKVMRKSYKTIGYRVQVYAGGNSRADRQRAENIRERLKQELPNEPIYTHFYSPRWICRIGNYRSYEEAARMLDTVKKMGYKQASIVRGDISVQY